MKKFTIDDAYEIDAELKKREQERKLTERKHLKEAEQTFANRNKINQLEVNGRLRSRAK